MKRFVFLSAVIVSLAIFAMPSTAQEIPFTIGCLADEDKALEITFCQAVLAAAHAHEFMRESAQDDYSLLMLWVIPVQGQDDKHLAVAVQLNLSAKSFGGAQMALNTICYFVPEDEIAKYAATLVGRAYQNAPKDLSIFAPAAPEPLRLETSPP